MNFTNEELKEVEELSGHFFSIEEIAIFLNKAPQQLKKLIRQKNNEFYIHLMRGQLKAEYEVRKVILLQAKRGSSVAQKDILQLIKSTRLKDLR